MLRQNMFSLPVDHINIFRFRVNSYDMITNVYYSNLSPQNCLYRINPYDWFKSKTTIAAYSYKFIMYQYMTANVLLSHKTILLICDIFKFINKTYFLLAELEFYSFC